MVSPQHYAGMSRPHCAAHSPRQQLIGASNCAWERHVHKVLIFFQMLEGQVSKIVHRIVYNKTGRINKLTLALKLPHFLLTLTKTLASFLHFFDWQVEAGRWQFCNLIPAWICPSHVVGIWKCRLKLLLEDTSEGLNSWWGPTWHNQISLSESVELLFRF